MRGEREREGCLRGDILSACKSSSRGATNSPSFPAAKGRGGRWVSVAVWGGAGAGVLPFLRLVEPVYSTCTLAPEAEFGVRPRETRMCEGWG